MKSYLIFFEKKNINVNLHYIPVHLHPFYKSLGFKKGSFKNSEKHSSQSISLPIFPNLSQTNVLKISNLINNFFKKFSEINTSFA